MRCPSVWLGLLRHGLSWLDAALRFSVLERPEDAGLRMKTERQGR
jgi:hypothetical protein